MNECSVVAASMEDPTLCLLSVNTVSVITLLRLQLKTCNMQICTSVHSNTTIISV